ncbi:MAG TPA: plastocyanin/azurin family copper-binding protein [Solirubrobacterales bacterium]|jgi:plastocyanin|nr:plastocyanin/azurin family copper-binding protein [Solirubrobacterales bacterium]
MKKLLLLLAVVALSAFGLAACGGDDDDDGGETTAAATTTTDTGAASGGGAGGTVKITAAADGSLAYDQTEVSAPAGSVTIDFDNPASLSHDVVVEDSAGEELGATDLIAESNTSTTVDLQPGSYTFFCSVSGHREAGMEGTLTAK